MIIFFSSWLGVAPNFSGFQSSLLSAACSITPTCALLALWTCSSAALSAAFLFPNTNLCTTFPTSPSTSSWWRPTPTTPNSMSYLPSDWPLAIFLRSAIRTPQPAFRVRFRQGNYHQCLKGWQAPTLIEFAHAVYGWIMIWWWRRLKVINRRRASVPRRDRGRGWRANFLYTYSYLKYNNSIKWMIYGSKNHLKYLSKTVQNIFMNCLSERNFTCPVRPIIVSKLLSLSHIYLSSMLNTMSILENYLHPIFCSIPSIISRRIWPSCNPNLSDIIVWFCYTLADSYGTYLSWHELINARFLKGFKLPLLLNLYKKQFLLS